MNGAYVSKTEKAEQIVLRCQPIIDANIEFGRIYIAGFIRCESSQSHFDILKNCLSGFRGAGSQWLSIDSLGKIGVGNWILFEVVDHLSNGLDSMFIYDMTSTLWTGFKGVRTNQT